MRNVGYLKAVLLITSTLTVMAGATIAPSLPQMAEVFADQEGAEFLSKLILTVPALFIAISAPFAGWLTDRFGRKKLLLSFMVLYAVGGSSGLYLDGLEEILVGRAFLGLAVAGIMTICTTLAGDYFDGEEREHFLGKQSAFMAFGGMIYVTLGGLLADLHWRAPFALYLTPLVLMFFAYNYLYEPAKPDHRTYDSGRSLSGNALNTVIFVYLFAFFSMLAFYMVPVQLPFLLQKSFQVNSTMVGLAITASAATGAITAINYRRIRLWLSFSEVYATSFILVSIAFAIIYWAPAYIFVVGAMFINGIGVGMMMPNSSLWLITVAPPKVRGRVIGGLTTAFFIGQFLSPVYVSLIGDPQALGSSFGYTVIGLLLLVVVIFFVGKQLEKQRLRSQH